MPLLCYSTTVPVGKTVGEIMKLLRLVHAKTLQIESDHLGNYSSIAFELGTSHGDRLFRFPVSPEKVGKVLMRQSQRGELTHLTQAKAGDPEHHRRVAWRENLEWLRVQLALLESEQVTLEQIFLPYMLVNGRTIYQIMEAAQFKTLPSGQEE